MIYGDVTHPEVLSVLSKAGHSAKILIADGHFPSSILIKDTPVVYLNYAPGVLSVEEVLIPLLKVVPIESAIATTFEDGSQPDVWKVYKNLLPKDVAIEPVLGSALGEVIDTSALVLVILTGEIAPASCIVLTMGIRHD